MIWIIIGVIVALVLFYACANAFYEIACMKGHDEKKYFWWTFFIPLLGALMVIALPDRVSTKERLTDEAFPVLNLSKKESPLHVSAAVPSAYPTADVSKAEQPASPIEVAPLATDAEDVIECPACGLVQKANRTVCWECGAKFIKG